MSELTFRQGIRHRRVVLTLVRTSPLSGVRATLPRRLILLPALSLPIPNSYWVRRGLLLAGEYPGHELPAAASRKIALFLDAGIRNYVDLTADADRMAPYETLIQEHTSSSSAADVSYVRHPVRDMDVPSPATMHEILDDIDAAIAAGRPTYVHCWGGIGRTGTVIGCHLVRHGFTGDAALREVARLFATTPKAPGFPEGSPQTEPQRELVRGWQDHETARGPDASIPHLRDRFRGALLGLAVGDALGTTVEFEAPQSFPPVLDMVGGGPFRLRPGEWTDDTSMALCLAESLIERGKSDSVDQMQRYLRWYHDGHLSSTGRCFDIGTTTRGALRAFEQTGDPFSGPLDPHTAGNGSLMRLAPVPLFFFLDPEEACARAADSSRTTHGARTSVDACRYFAALLMEALRGASKDHLLSPTLIAGARYWSERPLDPAIQAIADGSFARKEPPHIRGSGYVVESLEAALWAFHRSDNFRDGCLLAVNLGNDADTTAAIYGQLAGAFYGEEAIPSEWRSRVAKKDLIIDYADRLYAMSMGE
jgi:ADP-ribosylglycohydrolase